MSIAAELFLTFTLTLCGGYAGMVLMCQIGILPGLSELDLSSFANSWRAIDRYMEKLMPPYKGALLLCNVGPSCCSVCNTGFCLPPLAQSACF